MDCAFYPTNSGGKPFNRRAPPMGLAGIDNISPLANNQTNEMQRLL